MPASSGARELRSGRAELELMVGSRGEVVTLLSPGVGLFIAARAVGDLLAPGTSAGVLLVLGKAFDLVVPRGVEGRVRTAGGSGELAAGSRPARQPVGWGDALYEIEPRLASGAGSEASGVTTRHDAAAARSGPSTGTTDGSLLVRSLQGGRFYLRPGPGDEPFAPVGAVVETGQPLGLIEVMKTFAHVHYAGEGLPARARVVRALVEDGAEIAAGDPLFEVAPA